VGLGHLFGLFGFLQGVFVGVGVLVGSTGVGVFVGVKVGGSNVSVGVEVGRSVGVGGIDVSVGVKEEGCEFVGVVLRLPFFGVRVGV
jgi:hypothetical protein